MDVFPDAAIECFFFHLAPYRVLSLPLEEVNIKIVEFWSNFTHLSTKLDEVQRNCHSTK